MMQVASPTRLAYVLSLLAHLFWYSFAVFVSFCFILPALVGLLPISGLILCLSIAPGILLVSTISAARKNRWRIPIRIVLGVLLIYVSLWIYFRFLDGGLNHAKAYGKALALSIESFHMKNSRWPDSLTEMPKNSLPPSDWRSNWPYICREPTEGSCAVSGFLIEYWYFKGDPKPRLSLWRMGLVSLVWNWEKSDWELKP